MTLTEHIEEIRNSLERGVFPDVAAVKMGIVQRLIGALEWPLYNPQTVIPDYSALGRKIDFALCHPASNPVALIEVKAVGNIRRGEQQLLEYNVQPTAPIVILTDGQEWHFFHPSRQGDFRERKVHAMDVRNDDLEESADRLDRYLNYHAIQLGEALRSISIDYEKAVKQREIEKRLPEAWEQLIAKADDLLLDVVAEETEKLCGVRPTDEQVLGFLKDLGKPEPPAEKMASPLQNTLRKDGIQGSKKAPTRLTVTMANGEKIEHQYGSTTFVEVIERLGIERVQALGLRSNGVPLISPHEHSGYQQRQVGKYYVMTGSSSKDKKKSLEKIAARLRVNLKAEIVPKT